MVTLDQILFEPVHMLQNNFFNGFQYLLDGFHLIFRSGMKRYIIIPLILNILLFIGLFAVANHFFKELNHWVVHFLPHWLQWLSYIFWIVFLFAFFLISIYLFVTLANLIGAPFYSFLSEKVEFHLTQQAKENQSWLATIKSTPKIIGRQLQILGYFLPRAILIVFLFFVPVIQVFAAFFWFLFNAWFMTLQNIDYPTDNNQVSLERAREWLNDNRWCAWGFGVGLVVLSMVPVINLLVVPAAVAGATKMWVDGR